MVRNASELRDLGMHRRIPRRNFLNGLAPGLAGTSAALRGVSLEAQAPASVQPPYPPARHLRHAGGSGPASRAAPPRHRPSAFRAGDDCQRRRGRGSLHQSGVRRSAPGGTRAAREPRARVVTPNAPEDQPQMLADNTDGIRPRPWPRPVGPAHAVNGQRDDGPSVSFAPICGSSLKRFEQATR